MIETPLPLEPALSVTATAPDSTPLLQQLATVRLENAALRAENAVLQARVRELEARLGQTSSSSSRPRRPIYRRPRGNAQLSRRAASEAGSQDTGWPSDGCCQSSR
jgi:hypothetical protein